MYFFFVCFEQKTSTVHLAVVLSKEHKFIIFVNNYFYVTSDVTVTGFTIIPPLDFVLHDLILPVSFLALSSPIICSYFIKMFVLKVKPRIP